MAGSIGDGAAAVGTNRRVLRPRAARIPGQRSIRMWNAGAAGPWIDMAETDVLRLKRLTLPSGAGVALWLAGPAGPAGGPEHLWKALSRGGKEGASRFLRAEDR